MKLILFLLFFYSFVTFRQESKDESCVSKTDSLTQKEVFTLVDKMPEVNGGMQAVFKEVMKRLKYPNNNTHPIETKIFVAFIVTESGGITGQRILKNIKGTDFAEQLLDVVSEHEWEPGECYGKPVATIMILPLHVDYR